MTAQEFVDRVSLANRYLKGLGIEVGALHNPLALPEDASVRYVDRMPKDDLYVQYPELLGHNLVDVDIVDDGETLATFSDASLDFVVANHFIEHCEDPIGTLRTFSRVLRPGGVAFVAVPKMSATFDRARQETPLAHLIKDHTEGPAWSRFGHFVEWARDVEPTWGRIYAEPATLEERARELETMRYSIHFHCWEPAGCREFLDYGAAQAGLQVVQFIVGDEEMVAILIRAD